MKRLLGGVANRVLAALLKLLLRLRGRLMGAPRLRIIAFDGYATEDRCVVRGHVVNERDDDTSLLRRVLRRAVPTEIPYARVRASLQGCSGEAVADEQGFFRIDLRPGTPPAPQGGWCTARVELVDAPVRFDQVRSRMEALAPRPSASFAILSDLDDTVVRSRTRNKLDMIRRLLLRRSRDREVVPGTPELYRALEAGASGRDGNPVFYHSSQSWNLYDHVRDYLEQNGLPRGPMFLRQYNVERLLTAEEGQSKVSAAEEVLRAYPDLPFLLIGDSAGDDPEAYLEVLRSHGRRIRAVYMRRTASRERARQVEEIIAQMREHEGTEVLLIERMDEIGTHAADCGWIRPKDLELPSRSTHAA